MTETEEDRDQELGRIPTPNLVEVYATENYNEISERAFEHREYCRSRSSNYSTETSLSKRSRRGLRRGNNWTRRKGASSRTRYHYASSDRSSRPPSECSSFFISERASSVDSFEEELEERSPIEIPYEYYRSRFTCTEIDCNFLLKHFENLDTLNCHKKAYHKMRALFPCRECDKTYTSQSDLKTHIATHDVQSVYCSLCGDEFPNVGTLQVHLERHMKISIDCYYCDKSFINKQLLKYHCLVSHMYKLKKRIRRRSKVSIKKLRMYTNESPKKSRRKPPVNVDYSTKTFNLFYLNSYEKDKQTLNNINNNCTNVNNGAIASGSVEDCSNSNNVIVFNGDRTNINNVVVDKTVKNGSKEILYRLRSRKT